MRVWIKIIKKVESKIDKRIKNFHLSEEMSDMIIDWVNYQKKSLMANFKFNETVFIISKKNLP